MKVLFIDRDGTIIEDYPDEVWSTIEKPAFIEDSIDLLKTVRKLGFEIIIVTNQYLINENIITIEQFKTVHKKMLERLKEEGIEILETFYCPHSRKENCNCRKPNPGLIEQALKKFPHIDINKSFVIGDSMVDALLADKFNMYCFLLNGNENLPKCINVKGHKDIINYLLQKNI